MNLTMKRKGKLKKENSKSIDMLHGPLLKKMILFAMPIAASSMLQQLFNATDTAVVGSFAGKEALAAVGSTASAINLLVTLFTGISIGANVVIANYIGRGDRNKISSSVHTAYLIALLGGFVVGIAGFFISKPLLILMATPDDVIGLSTLYMRIYFCGMPFFMVYNFGASILRSKGDTTRPLICLAVSGVINVCLNLLLVAVFDMSVAGVAIATVTSNAVSAAFITRILITETDEFKLNLKKLTIRKEHARRMFLIGIPTGIQSMVFSLSNVFIQSALNGFGSDAIAGSAAALNFEFFAYFIIAAFVQTAVTFTSQNYGANKLKRCREIFWKCMLMAIIGVTVFDWIVMLFKGPLFGLFTSDEAVAQWGYIRMWHILIFNVLATSYEVSAGAMRGMGHSITPAVLIILGSCVFRIAWLYLVFPFGRTFELLLDVYPASWLITGISVFVAYLIVRNKEEVRLVNRHNI